MRIEYCEYGGLKYITRYPRGYKDGDRCPVIVFLHGSGTRGDDLDMVKSNCFFPVTEKIENFPFITIAPQCCAKTWFDVFERLRELLYHVYDESYTDKARVYIMGTSLGGYGTWQTCISMPEIFAAAAPICGGGMPSQTCEMVNVPVWAFHGDRDDAVYIEEARFMVDELNKSGGNGKLTVYEGKGHCIWEETYAREDLYEWFLSHENTNAIEVGDNFSDMTLYG